MTGNGADLASLLDLTADRLGDELGHKVLEVTVLRLTDHDL